MDILNISTLPLRRPSDVRSETILGFEDLVRELGVDPEPLYHRAGLPASLFDNLDYMVPYLSVCALIVIAARELMQADFGLIQRKNLTHVLR